MNKDISVNDKIVDNVDDYVNHIKEEDAATYPSELESFEMHRNHLRMEILNDIKEFMNRFLGGYEILMDELSQLYPHIKRAGDRLPPNAIKI